MTKEQLIKIINELDFDILTDREISFLGEMERIMEKFGFIADGQEEKVEEIREKYR